MLCDLPLLYHLDVCRMQVLDTISSYSDEVCERIIQADLPSDMLSYLHWDTLSTATLNDSQPTYKRRFVERIMSILYNVVARTDSARDVLRQHQAFHTLNQYRDVTESPVIYSSNGFDLYVTRATSLQSV